MTALEVMPMMGMEMMIHTTMSDVVMRCTMMTKMPNCSNGMKKLMNRE